MIDWLGYRVLPIDTMAVETSWAHRGPSDLALYDPRLGASSGLIARLAARFPDLVERQCHHQQTDND